MKIIFIVPNIVFENKIDMNYPQLLKYIENKSDKTNQSVVLQLNYLNSLNKKQRYKLLCLHKPNLIYFMDINHLRKFHNATLQTCKNKPLAKIPRIMFTEDIFNFETYNTKSTFAINGVLNTVKMPLIIEKFRKHFPHLMVMSLDSTFINVDVFKDYKLSKKYDIIFYGNTNKTWYPFRSRIFNLLLKNKHKYRIHFVQFPTEYLSQ